jgi:hypothetical protein
MGLVSNAVDAADFSAWRNAQLGVMPYSVYAVLTHPSVRACIQEHHHHVSRLRYNADILTERQKLECAALAGKALQDAVVAALQVVSGNPAAQAERAQTPHRSEAQK